MANTERIKPLTLNLISLLKNVEEFGGRVGPALSSIADPSATEIPVPCAWALFVGAQNQTEERRFSDVNYEWSVSVVLSYESAEVLLNNSYRTLDKAVAAVSGQDSLDFAGVWRFAGQQLVDVTADKMIYELRFTVATTFC